MVILTQLGNGSEGAKNSLVAVAHFLARQLATPALGLPSHQEAKRAVEDKRAPLSS